MEDVRCRREFLHNFVEKTKDMINDYESIKK